MIFSEYSNKKLNISSCLCRGIPRVLFEDGNIIKSLIATIIACSDNLHSGMLYGGIKIDEKVKYYFDYGKKEECFRKKCKKLCIGIAEVYNVFDKIYKLNSMYPTSNNSLKIEVNENTGVLHLYGVCEYNSSERIFAYKLFFRKGKIIDTDYSKNKNKNQIKIRLKRIDERDLECVVNNLLDEFKSRLGKLKTKVYVTSRSTLNTSIAVEEIVTLREFKKRYLA